MKQPALRSSTNPLNRIFAFRAVDLRDRFPQPLETFREALECLQSDRSYMSAMSGEIIAYLRGGYTLTIPEHFYLRRYGGDITLVRAEENNTVCARVEAWLRSALAAHEKDLPEGVPPEARPYSLDHLLGQCDPQAPHPDDLRAWLEMSDAGRDVLEFLNDNDVWAAAESVFGDKEEAHRWMAHPLRQLEGRTPEEMLAEDPQQVYDLLIRIDYGVYM